jgi:branched-chain amino acid transport system ATP-binding protein
LQNDKILETRRLTKVFGGITAISELDLSIFRGEIVGLIGPNGAGKTTLFNLVTGFYRPTKGKVLYNGEDITGLRPDKIAEKGIVRTFQQTLLFSNITVIQNVVVAAHLQSRPSFWQAVFKTPMYKDKEKNALHMALELLHYVGLSHVKDELACNLPHGYQRILGIAIALAANPAFLLLDEPMTGMNQEETEAMMDLIKKINKKGITVLLVEHNMRAIMGICERIIAINFGRKIAEGSPLEIAKNEDVIQAYLGA